MARKLRKSRKTKLPWKKFLLSRRGMTLMGAILLLVLGLISADLRDNVAEALSIPNPNKPLASKIQGPVTEGVWTVVYVVDGDTFDVARSGDTKYRIRLIGADTPETKRPNTPVEPYGPEATEFTKQMIAAANNRVRLAFDGDQVDRYNRNLAMVYLQMPDGKEIWLNELLIREGLATAQLQYRYSKGAKEAFKRAEDEAKRGKRNIWSLPARP